MTNPDILATEKFGSVRPERTAERIGECLYCEADIYDDNGDAVGSTDGMFCDMDCCCEYYEITPCL